MNRFKASALLSLVSMVFLAFLLFGCAQAPQTPAASASPIPSFYPSVQASLPAAIATVAGAGGAGEGAESAGGEESGLQFENWTAPDDSITLQKPVGWTATERQVDACTVDWSVTSPSGTSQAFANNQKLVFKSEAAKQMYAQYGLTGAAIAAAPVSGFLGVEQAIAQIVAPLSGSSGFKIVARDAEASQQFSQEVCFVGLAACDAQAFEAEFSHGGIAMRGSVFRSIVRLGRRRHLVD